MLLRELLATEILPQLSLADFRNFCFIDSKHLPLLCDENFWRKKCHLTLRDLYPKSARTWREHYLSFNVWSKLPLYKNGDINGCVSFQQETHHIFPPATDEIVLADCRRNKYTPLLKVDIGKLIAERVFLGDYPLLIDRAIIMKGIAPTKHLLRLRGVGENASLVLSVYDDILGEYQRQVREECTSVQGTPPIYGYRHFTWERGNKRCRFVIVDRREEHFNILNQGALVSCAERLGVPPNRSSVIEELIKRGHLLGDSWSL